MAAISQVGIDYFSFEKNEFYEWAANAPTSNLFEALLGYFKVLECGIEAVHKDADFTDPYFLNELNGIAGNFYDLGPWIMEIQEQLYRRCNQKRSQGASPS